MPLVQAQNDARIFLDEDFTEKGVLEEFVGRKAFSLFRLRAMDVPVPPFFAISGSLFSEYVTGCLRTSIVDMTSDDEVRSSIRSGTFPASAQQEILEAYSRLSGFTDSWVSVRSSVILPASRRDLGMAGLLDTVLNVRGAGELLSAIIQVYSSAFSEKTVAYLAQNNLSVSHIKVGIVVQKMVQAEASGVLFTVDPISQDEHYLTIEAVFGLGDVIASGEITPDQYVIEKSSLEFREKRIVPQDWMMVRRIKNEPGVVGDQKVQISKAWQHQQKLENRYIKELSRIGVIVEKKSGGPQDIEWVFEGGRLWLLQTMAIQPVIIPSSAPELPVTIRPSIIEAAQQIAQNEASKQVVKQEIAHQKKTAASGVAGGAVAEQVQHPPVDAHISKPDNNATIHGTPQEPILQSPLPGEKLLITGIGASGKAHRGIAIIAQNAAGLLEKKRLITRDTVLVVAEPFPDLDPLFSAAGAIVSDTGGMTSDLATQCREQNRPCIMGCHIATRMLHEGENILVDGTIGAIYGMRDTSAMREIAPSPEKPAAHAEEKTSQPDTTVSPIRDTRSPAAEVQPDTEPAPHPEPAVQPDVEPKVSPSQAVKTATKLYLDLSGTKHQGTSWFPSAARSDGVACVEIDDIYRTVGRHPEAFIEDGKKTDLIKRIADELGRICEQTVGQPVIACIGAMTSSQYAKLTRGQPYEQSIDGVSEGTRGLARLLQHPKELSVFFRAIRSVRNIAGWRNLSIAVTYAGTPKYLAEFKKLMTASGIRRSSTFKLYLTIATPSEALIVKDFLASGVDGVILDIAALAKHMMATGPDDDSIMALLDTIRTASLNSQVILQLPKEATSVIKKVVTSGFYGIAVGPSRVAETRSEIVRLEREAVFR